jgi:hypothetical protein
MVTVPNSSVKPAANPPYPLTDEERRRTAAAQQTKHEEPEDDDEDEWEKDDVDEDDDWELADKPPSEGKSAPVATEIPHSLRPGPPAGAVAKRPQQQEEKPLPPPPPQSYEPPTLHPQVSQMSLHHPTGIDPLESTISLPQSNYPLASQISLPASSVYSSSHSLPQNSAPTKPNNPFTLRPQNTGEQLFGSPSANPWGQAPVPVAKNAIYVDNQPVELSAAQTPPHEDFSKLHLTVEQRQELQPMLIPVETEEDYDHNRPRNTSNSSSNWNSGFDVSALDGRPSQQQQNLPSIAEPAVGGSRQHQEDLDRSERERRDHEARLAAERSHSEQIRRAEEERNQRVAQEYPPPPHPPPGQMSQSSNRPQVPEYYSIKQARWLDAKSNKLRTSPILTQSDNGPCPLLALINALVMSTPEGHSSSLIETMRTREQVSLSLLIEAIISHLAEYRDSSKPFPDLDELNKFLRGLHTGMNVNPRFIPNHNSDGIESYPGGFEATAEMRLYSLFNVPLLHGWLPSMFDESPAYDALNRSANTYEDAQNIQFGEEELEYKLSSTGLSPKEQDLFEDLHTIKGFLDAYRTQLTPHGLDVLHKSIAPAQFAILFRNDHFSTIYMEPRSGQLMTLVTDAGYASHEEIIWESLVDVSGRDSEMFSGDFRPVSHSATARPSNTAGGPPAGPRGSSLASNGQTINSMLDVSDQRPGRTQAGSNSQETGTVSDSQYGGLSQAEQEDHDLALAMQLQEEEEARARRETEARQRDTVLEPQNQRVNIPIHGPGPSPGPRRPSRTQQAPTVARPAVPPRRNRDDDEIPPPTYEQAASRPAFNPPVGHPASPNAPVQPGQPNPQMARPPPGMGPNYGPPGRGRGMVSNGREERNRDCVIM